MTMMRSPLLIRRRGSRDGTPTTKKGRRLNCSIDASESTVSIDSESSASGHDDDENSPPRPLHSGRADPDDFIEEGEGVDPDDYIIYEEGECSADPDDYIDMPCDDLDDDPSSGRTPQEEAAAATPTTPAAILPILASCESSVYLRNHAGVPYHRGPACRADPHTPAWSRFRPPRVQTRFIDEALALPSVVTERITRPATAREEVSALFYTKEEIKREMIEFYKVRDRMVREGADMGAIKRVWLGEEEDGSGNTSGTVWKLFKRMGSGGSKKKLTASEGEKIDITRAEF